MPGEIEPSGTQERAALQLTLSEREMKLVRMFLDGSASDNEIEAASIAFARSLRDRQVSAVDWEPLLEVIDPAEAVVEPGAPVATVHISHFQALVHYVLSVPLGPSPEHQLVPELANLHQQFRQQAIIFIGRIDRQLGSG
jgi:hypothetical protein